MNYNDISTLDNLQKLISKTHLIFQEIEDQEKRVSFLSQQKRQREREFTALKSQIKDQNVKAQTLENQLQQDYQLLERKKEQFSIVKSQKQLSSLEHEILSLKEKVNLLEEETLELYAQKDVTQQDFQQRLTYFKHIDESIEAVKEDSLKNIADIEKRKQFVQDQISEGESKLSPKAFSVYQKARQRHLRFLSNIKQGYCSQCGMQVPPSDLSAIQKNFSLMLCTGCQRILIPSS